MDICMLREDYEKLQDYLIANPDERYEVMSYKIISTMSIPS